GAAVRPAGAGLLQPGELPGGGGGAAAALLGGAEVGAGRGVDRPGVGGAAAPVPGAARDSAADRRSPPAGGADRPAARVRPAGVRAAAVDEEGGEGRAQPRLEAVPARAGGA